MSASLAGAAVWYAERGHLVFPLRPGTKLPMTKHGFKDASMNPDTIRAWWTREPQANIGLATGHLFDVIDVDGPDGITSFGAMEDLNQVPDITGCSKTPRGYHWLIAPTGDGCATAVRPGIDFRGIGGYIVAPPSIVDGVIYRWIDPPTASAPLVVT